MTAGERAFRWKPRGGQDVFAGAGSEGTDGLSGSGSGGGARVRQQVEAHKSPGGVQDVRPR